MKLKHWDQTVNYLLSCPLFILFACPSFYSPLLGPLLLIHFCLSPGVSSLHLTLTWFCSAFLHVSPPFYTTHPLLPSIPRSPASLHLFLYPLRWCTSRVLCLHQRRFVIQMGVCLQVWTWILITPTHHSTQAPHRVIQGQQVGQWSDVFLGGSEIFFSSSSLNRLIFSYELHRNVAVFVLQKIRSWRLPLCPTSAWRYFPICERYSYHSGLIIGFRTNM